MKPCSKKSSCVPEIGIVADDLTGACDSGVEFVPGCDSVLVVVESESEAPVGLRAGAIVYNTQSRNLPPEVAYERVFAATKRCLSSGANLIFKKVDSALRGNFGAEIGAVMDATAASIAFVLPAIPEAGRETIGGVQSVGGVPVAEGFYSRDPEHPVSESSVLRRAEGGSARSAGLIHLDDVRSGRTVESAERLRKQGCQVIVLDARSADDLRDAVRGLMQVRLPKVFVGCQGLAHALSAELCPIKTAPCALEKPGGPMLLVCGTPHPQSRRQLELAEKSSDVVSLKIQPQWVADSSRRNAPLKQFARTCQRHLLSGENVAVSIAADQPDFPQEFCNWALATLSNVSRRIIEAVHVGALVLTGGETAYSVCHSLGIRTLELHARIAPLVVASKVFGGPRDGLLVVTKGGSIGPDDLISKISDFLGKRRK